MRRRDRPIDIFKKLPIIRSVDEIIYDDESGLNQKVANVDELLAAVSVKFSN